MVSEKNGKGQNRAITARGDDGGSRKKSSSWCSLAIIQSSIELANKKVVIVKHQTQSGPFFPTVDSQQLTRISPSFSFLCTFVTTLTFKSENALACITNGLLGTIHSAGKKSQSGFSKTVFKSADNKWIFTIGHKIVWLFIDPDWATVDGGGIALTAAGKDKKSFTVAQWNWGNPMSINHSCKLQAFLEFLRYFFGHWQNVGFKSWIPHCDERYVVVSVHSTPTARSSWTVNNFYHKIVFVLFFVWSKVSHDFHLQKEWLKRIWQLDMQKYT